MRINTNDLRILSALLCVFCCAVAHAQPAVDLGDLARRSPAVASVLEAPRDTPADELQAVFTLLDLGEEEFAASLWNKFAGDGLKSAEKAALVSKFGAARFLNLARREQTNTLEGARDFARSCLQAAEKVSSDPRRLAQLIDDLASASAEVQRAARSDLAVTGDAGAIACLEALATADNEALRTQLMLTLAKMRPGVEPMLIAAIAGGGQQFRRDVTELVGYVRLQDAVPWLASLAAGSDDDPAIVSAARSALLKMGFSVPSPADARAVALSEIQRLETLRIPPAFNNTWWLFDAAEEKLTSREVNPNQKKILKTARLAHLLGHLPTATAADQRLALLYAFQVADLLGQPLSADDQRMADSLTTVDLSEALHEALQRDQTNAAIACVRRLGNRTDGAPLNSLGGQRSPLSRALAHPNRELRFAALEAVMKITPDQSFAGASGVPKALWFFASGAGRPQAIAASSVATRVSDWAGQLRGLGYDTAPVVTGRGALQEARDATRLEVLLVDSDINRPHVREVIFQLRSNPQTSRVPIAILSSSHNLSRARQMAAEDAFLVATSRPHSDMAMQAVLARLIEIDPDLQTAQQRSEQAVAALGWIAQLLETGHPYDELLREAKRIGQTLYDPDLTAASLRVLAVLGTAESQQLMLDYLSSPSLPIESRREAGDAFAISVQRYGKLLTSQQLIQQYDRYNASEAADPDTQRVLGAVLDILEK